MDIVERRTNADDAARRPLLILEAVRSFLDAHGLGSGALQAHRIGEGGGSNFSFLLEREEARGPFNLAAPQPLTNRDFSRALGKALHRPSLAPAPGKRDIGRRPLRKL